MSKGGFDSAVHISEEALNAKVIVPWAIICATSIGAILGWGTYHWFLYSWFLI